MKNNFNFKDGMIYETIQPVFKNIKRKIGKKIRRFSIYLSRYFL